MIITKHLELNRDPNIDNYHKDNKVSFNHLHLAVILT